MINIEEKRKDFKILREGINGKIPIYFDNSCMSLKPDRVVEAMNEYYYKYPACAGRSSHRLGDQVTKKIKEARQAVAKFINAKSPEEIIFTRNTTEGINLLANSFSLEKGDVILISDREHNSNLVPWLLQKEKRGIEVRILPSREDNTFDLEKFEELVKGVKLVSLVHTSNLDGVTIPAKEIIEIAHKNGSFVFLDCAQSAPHRKIDVRNLNVDFIAFSGHKMLGPTGTGVFYGKSDLLEKLAPFMLGGETVEYSTYQDYKLLPIPEKFEAGLQDYAGIIGLGEAVKYLSEINFEDIKEQELKLNTYLTEQLSQNEKIKIIGPKDPKERGGILNFYIEGVDMHKFALMLDEMAGVAIRSGQHCVHSWFDAKKIKNSARISVYFYNTMEEAEILISNLNKILKIIP